MSKYDRVLSGEYVFDMNRYFDEGWKLFKKGAGSFIGFTVLFFVIVIVLSMIPLLNLLANIFQYVLIGGFFIFCRNLMNNKEDFSQFFDGFKYFGQIFLYLLVLVLFFVPLIALLFTVLLPYELLPQLLSGTVDSEEFAEQLTYSFEGNLPVVLILYGLFIFAALYIYVSYLFALPLITDDKMQFWEAMETSRKVIGKKFFSFLGMFLLLGIGLVIGTIITCGLGLVMILPLYLCIVFSAYDSILSPRQDTMAGQIEEFGKTEKDINTESEDR